MNIQRSVRCANILIMGASVLFFAGCGDKSLSGTYVDQSGNINLAFESGGKVQYRANATGRNEQDTYAIDGKTVTVKSARGTVGKFTIEDDGCLRSPTMGTLCQPKSGS